MAGLFDDLIPPPAAAAPAAAPPGAPIAYLKRKGITIQVGGADDFSPDQAPPPPAAATAAPPEVASDPGMFSDLVKSQGKPGFFDAVGQAFTQPWQTLGHDIAQEYGRPHAPPSSVGDFFADAGHDLIQPFRIGGDMLGAAGSPFAAAMEAPAQLGADALDLSPLPLWKPGSFSVDGSGLHYSDPQLLDAAGKHQANADMLRTAFGAVRGGPVLDMAKAMGPGLPASMSTPWLSATGGMVGSGAPAISRDAAQAQNYVAKLARREDATPESVAAADPNLTGAEAIGPAAVTGLSALSRQPGKTAQLLGDVFNQRKTTRGERILDAVSSATGVPPEAAQGSIDALVKQGQSEAAPLYEEAHAAGPVWSDTIGKILQTDAGKHAVKYAHVLMSNEMKDPNALGMAFVEDPEQWASYEPPATQVASPEPQVGFAPQRAAGPAKPPSQGPSLVKYLADTGGIYDPGGDVADMGGDTWHIGRPYQRRLTDSGRYPDQAAEAAWEAGYFPQHDAPPTTNELLDAMREEMRGKPVYARQPDQGHLDRFNRANASEELAYRGGHPDDVPDPDQYVGRPEPKSEPAHQYVPNAQTIDYIKRGFDQQLAPYYSGKIEWDDVGRSIEGLRQQFVTEAKSLNPAYATALDRSGDYLSSQDAFRRGGLDPFNNRLGPTRFAEQLQGMTPPQLLAYRAGMANRIYNEVLASRTQPTGPLNTLLTPMLQTKMRMLLGEKAAGRLADTLQAEARMKGAEDYYGPKANSGTANFAAAMADQNEVSPLREFVAGTARNAHRGITRAPLAGAGPMLERMIASWTTPGMSVEARDQAGRMLAGISHADLAEILRRANDSSPGGLSRPQLLRGMIGGGARN